jgi:hypothetical protein
MMKRALLLVVAIAGSIRAQSLPNIPRATVGGTGGLNDSALVLVSDSAHRTRAASLAQMRKGLSLKGFDSLFTTSLRLTGATVTGSATWGGLQTFASAQRVDSATGAARASALVGSPAITVSSCTGCGGGGATVSDTIKNVTFDSVRTLRLRADTIRSRAGASQRLVLQTTTSGSALTTALRFNEVQQSLFADGSAARPGISMSSDSTMGLYKSATNILSIGLEGAARVDFPSGSVSSSVIRPTTNGTRDIGETGKEFRYVLGQYFDVGNSATITDATSPNFTFNADLNTGMYRPGADTLGFSTGGAHSLGIRGGASPTIFGGAGNMTIQAGTGNSRTLTLQSTTSAGTATTAMRFNEVQQSLVVNGAAAKPSVAFASDTANGMYRIASNKVGFATQGAETLTITGGSSSVIGGNSTLTIMGSANGGVSGTLTLQTTNNAGTTTTFASGSGDTLTIAGHAKGAGNLTAASGTPGSICYVTANGEITKNAATSCVVSSIRFKNNVAPLSLDSATNIVSRLTPVTYTMKDGGRPSLHVIAEQADSISRRLSFYDAEGRINSVDDGAILSALLRVVQDQQRQLDSIKAAPHRRKP